MTQRSIRVDLAAQVVVFDLDDTLCMERQFAVGGFAAAGNLMKQDYGISGFGDYCLNLLDAGFRGNIFNRALAHFRVDDTSTLMNELISRYRSHSPDLTLMPDAVSFLNQLSGYKTALITDGPEVTQAAKVDALSLDQHIDFIILTGQLPEGYSKPHPHAFEQVMEWSGLDASLHVYIADNAGKDFLAPRRLGWKTVQIFRPGRMHNNDAPTPEHEADYRIASFEEIGLI
ncbi:MAG: HAD family hydrolase [Sphingomonadaceae bacterium]